jgi:transposase InsO family protein
MCSLLGISKSAYYAWTKRATHTQDKDAPLVERITAIVKTHRGYGYRRITAELARQDVCVNHKRVQRVMRAHGLTKKKKRAYKVTTESAHEYVIYPNLVRGLRLTRVNQLWVADITFIRLGSGFVYLAVILDAFSRKVVGWALRDYLEHELALAALRMALARRSIGSDLIHHSDRGTQYACRSYVWHLEKSEIAISMSRSGNPYDNAKAESFMATLKKEEVYLSKYKNVTDAHLRIGRFIEDVYNEKRLHSSLGYVPPIEFEQSL